MPPVASCRPQSSSAPLRRPSVRRRPDFFSVEVLNLRGLARYVVFVVIDLKTRRVEIAGICPYPAGPWMKQIARNLTDCDDRFLRQIRYLILYGDRMYSMVPETQAGPAGGRVARRERLGGLLNFYYREAAYQSASRCSRVRPRRCPEGRSRDRNLKNEAEQSPESKGVPVRRFAAAYSALVRLSRSLVSPVMKREFSSNPLLHPTGCRPMCGSGDSSLLEVFAANLKHTVRQFADPADHGGIGVEIADFGPENLVD
ncbi:MAG: hypothetical protein ACI9OJ_002766 [Myxococcota bacterium]